jgi:hypothetical protein
MANPLPKGLNTVGTVLAELAIGAIIAMWWFFPPTSGLGFLIAPAIALGSSFVLFIAIGLLWPKKRDESVPPGDAG